MTLGNYLNSQFTLLQTLEFFLRILLAGLFGAAIGFERTRRFKEAGIRTHVIVCTASALMMLVSKYGFVDFPAPGGLFSEMRPADPARIAAQVVTGISFLGAGVIFKNGSTVKGLTTAAGIWATAGIGLAVGAGMYWLGLFTTLLIAVTQVAMHRFTFGADAYNTCKLRLKVRDDGNFQPHLQDRLQLWKAKAVNVRMARGDNGIVSYELTLRTQHDITAEDLLLFSREHSEILEISNSLVD
jgi:putative Mg2+ transporter-C (MgtC) family protein